MFNTLPSLKNICQRELSKAASTPSTFVRCVHQTSKQQTILLNLASESKSRYASMNLQGLKMECKRRGLKVSGKKIELVQRLANSSGNSAIDSKDSRNFSTNNTKRPQNTKKKTMKHQENVLETKKFSTTKVDEAPIKTAVKLDIVNNRPFSTIRVEQTPIKAKEPVGKVSTRLISSTSLVEAKGDSSHIDFFKFPPTPHFENKIEHLQVPSLSSNASSKGFATTPTPVNASNPAVSLGVETTTPVNTGGEILVNKHDQKIQEDFTPSSVTYYGSKANSSSHEYDTDSKNSLDSNDKLFFSAFALLTLGWWSLKEEDRN